MESKLYTIKKDSISGNIFWLKIEKIEKEQLLEKIEDNFFIKATIML